MLYNNKFRKLKTGYFKNIAMYKSNSERLYGSFNFNNYSENYRNYIYYKTMLKTELNISENEVLSKIVKDLNEDEIILNVDKLLDINKNSYKRNGCIYTYYTYENQVVESTHCINLLYLPLLSMNNKFIIFDKNETIGIYLHQLHKIILLQSNKLDSCYKIWKQPNVNTIRLYDKNSRNNRYIQIKCVSIDNKLYLYDYITYYSEKPLEY